LAAAKLILRAGVVDADEERLTARIGHGVVHGRHKKRVYADQDSMFLDPV
jgi:hypothetical protein